MQNVRDGFFREILKTAKAQGFRVERTRGSHWAFIPPDPTAEIVIASATTSGDRRKSVYNILSRLRRSGYQG